MALSSSEYPDLTQNPDVAYVTIKEKKEKKEDKEDKGKLPRDQEDPDVRYAREIGDAVSNAVVRTGEGMVICCSVCCMSCKACLGAFAVSCEKFATKLAYPLIGEPLVAGVGAFFENNKGESSFFEPFKKIIRIPPNLFAIFAESFLPLSPDGHIGWPFFPAVGGRILESFHLLTGACRGKKEESIAVVTGAAFAMYGMTLMMGLMNACINWASDDDAPTLGDIFNPLQVIQNLMKGNPDAFQEFLIFVAGYIGLTGGYIAGKEKVRGFKKFCQQFMVESRKVEIEKAIKQVVELNEGRISEEQLKNCIESTEKISAITLTGQVLKRIMQIPAAFLDLPSDVTQKTTLIKGLMNAEAQLKDAAKKEKSCTKRIADCAGWNNTSDSKVMSFQDMLDRVKGQYYRIVTAPTSAKARFYQDPRSGEQIRLDEELVKRYLQDVARAKVCASNQMTWTPGLPVLPSDAPPPPAFNPWADDMGEKNLGILRKMVVGDFSDIDDFYKKPDGGDNQPLHVKARCYWEIVYNTMFRPESAPKLQLDR